MTSNISNPLTCKTLFQKQSSVSSEASDFGLEAKLYEKVETMTNENIWTILGRVVHRETLETQANREEQREAEEMFRTLRRR